MRAVLVEDVSSGKDVSTRECLRDAGTLATSHPLRAVLIEGDACGERCPSTLPPPEQRTVLTGSGGGRVHRVITTAPYRVVALTPRCLARFQSVPDWYELPEKKSLATKIIGNGVPSLMTRAIFGPMMGED